MLLTNVNHIICTGDGIFVFPIHKIFQKILKGHTVLWRILPVTMVWQSDVLLYQAWPWMSVHVKAFLWRAAGLPCDTPATADPSHFHRLCRLKISISSNFHFCFWILKDSTQASLPLSTGSQPLIIPDISPCLVLVRMITSHLPSCWKCRSCVHSAATN